MDFEKLHTNYERFRRADAELTASSGMAADQKRRERDDYYAALDIELSEQRRQNVRVCRRSGLDEHAAEEIFDDTVFKLVRKNDVENFGKLFLKSLRESRFDYIRKEKRRNNRYRLEWQRESEDGEEAATSEIAKAQTERNIVEHEALQKKEADKIALVDSVLEASQLHLGSRVTAIIRELQIPSLHSSINAAATAHGMKRNDLVRPIQRLAKRFYESGQLDDIRDYLPKDVRVRREFISA